MKDNVKIEGHHGPWLNFALKEGEGYSTEFQDAVELTISQCAGRDSGYKRVSKTITPFVSPSKLAKATGFSLGMTESDVPRTCSQ
jgi:hypothetical protein